jgi:fatty acid synthase
MGKIVDYNRFDSSYFGLMEQMVNEVDPQARMLLEITHEAIMDAGSLVYLINTFVQFS